MDVWGEHNWHANLMAVLSVGVAKLDVHGDKRGLNLIAYIAGEFASGKGKIDPVVDAWMAEERTLNKMYEMQEEEWTSSSPSPRPCSRASS